MYRTLRFPFVVHSFFHQAFWTAVPVSGYISGHGNINSDPALPLEAFDLVRERDANTVAAQFTAFHRGLAEVRPCGLPTQRINGDAILFTAKLLRDGRRVLWRSQCPCHWGCSKTAGCPSGENITKGTSSEGHVTTQDLPIHTSLSH